MEFSAEGGCMVAYGSVLVPREINMVYVEQGRNFLDFCFCFSPRTEDQTQSLVLASQVLYH